MGTYQHNDIWFSDSPTTNTKNATSLGIQLCQCSSLLQYTDDLFWSEFLPQRDA